ncbi:hypothetical protein KHA93_22680 [Bacillus sp. FJAT-49732]|uniref:Uncharacterized protein n=1 Tax=Lederbergia citrisecunda TaxID=2833583 RepID=A0A942YN67_9BACI|nr:hypothetical protein [Lederbergia citrisecunda]MBS4202412.1 hypothetical protein [Lederbergia citrisecunda]
MGVLPITMVGKNIDEYKPKNLPYFTTFMADENGVIDIVIQGKNNNLYQKIKDKPAEWANSI